MAYSNGSSGVDSLGVGPFFGWPTGPDPKRVLTTGSFRVLQCNSSQKPFVAFGYVPKAEFHFGEMPARYRS
jgi:hypothetical protein